MTTKTAKQINKWFRTNCDPDLLRSDGCCGNGPYCITLISTNEFSDKLEKKCEKAGFTIINWTSNNYEHDIEIEVAK